MAFSWICCIFRMSFYCLVQGPRIDPSRVLVFSYFFLLIFTAVAHTREDPEVWHCRVRRFPQNSSQRLRSATVSPRFDHPGIVAPKPCRVVPTAIYTYRSSLSSHYDTGQFQSPTPVEEPVAAWRRQMQNTRRLSDSSCFAISFYPQHMQTILAAPPVTRPPQTSELPSSRPSPPVVGSLPATQPLRGKWTNREKAHLPAGGNNDTVGDSNPSSRPRPKPTGPRSRSNSCQLSPS